MKAIIDTNVIVDVLAKHEPFFVASAMVLDHAETKDRAIMESLFLNHESHEFHEFKKVIIVWSKAPHKKILFVREIR